MEAWFQGGRFLAGASLYRREYTKNRLPLSDSRVESDEEIIRKIDELMKDPERLKQAIESRMDKVVKNWPKR